MDTFWSTAIWRQFGGAIDMLENAIKTCPDPLWNARLWKSPALHPEFSEFWYIIFHTLFFLDLYLSGTVEGFVPPAPFTMDELDPAGILPDWVYSKEELQAYLDHGRSKCRSPLVGLTDEKARQICRFPAWKEERCFGELLLGNMRHVQEHTAQLNLFLGQEAGLEAARVGRTKNGLPFPA